MTVTAAMRTDWAYEAVLIDLRQRLSQLDKCIEVIERIVACQEAHP